MKVTDQMLIDAYSGQGGFEDGSYLVKHPREADEKFTRRKDICYYPNYTRKVVGIYLSYLFSQAVHRESALDIYNQFLPQADGRRNMTKVMRSAWLNALCLGTVCLVVDRAQGTPATAAEERAVLPYVALRLPTQVQSLKLDAAGRVAEAVFVEGKIYRWYTAEGWKLTEDADGAKILEQGAYAFGRPPVVLLHSTEPAPGAWRARAWHYDIFRANYDLFQAVSEVRELFRAQTFSVLALPVKDMAQAEAMANMTIGTENALPYNPEGGGQPAFIAPPNGPVELYLKWIDSLRDQIYDAANLEFTGGIQQSGTAVSFFFQLANKTLADMAEMCEQAETEVAELVCAWAGQPWAGVVAYPRDFAVSDLLNELKIGMDSIDLQIAPTFDRALKKRLARSLLGQRVTQADLAAIDAEIDAEGDLYGDRIAREAQQGGV